MAGPEVDPSRLRAADQVAIAAVQEALRRWKRYEVTNIVEDADLILAVRKAPGVAITWGKGPAGTPVPPTVNNPFPTTADSLAVFDAHGLGMEAPPLWTAVQAGGLNGPDVPLVSKLRKAVEAAEKKRP